LLKIVEVIPLARSRSTLTLVSTNIQNEILPTANCKPPTGIANCQLQTANCNIPAMGVLEMMSNKGGRLSRLRV